LLHLIIFLVAPSSRAPTDSIKKPASGRRWR